MHLSMNLHCEYEAAACSYVIMYQQMIRCLSFLSVFRPCGSRHMTSWSRGPPRLVTATGTWSRSCTWAWTRWRTPSPNAGSTWPARSSWSTAWTPCGAPPSAPPLRTTTPSKLLFLCDSLTPTGVSGRAHTRSSVAFKKIHSWKCCIPAVCSLWTPLLLSYVVVLFLRCCLQLLTPRETLAGLPPRLLGRQPNNTVLYGAHSIHKDTFNSSCLA